MSNARLKRKRQQAAKKSGVNNSPFKRVELLPANDQVLAENVAVEPVDMDEVGEEEEAKEIEQKELMPIYDTYQPTFGATDFDELDAARNAYRQTEETRANANDLQSIISNILYDDNIEDKASAIEKAAGQFKKRMTSMPKKKSNPVLDFFAKFIPQGKSQAKNDQAQNLRVYKDKSGSWRWLGIFSNKFEDTSEEIITEAAHKEFMAYLDENPDKAPLFVPWHTMQAARKHRADFWDYSDGFVLMGGRLEEKEAIALQGRQKEMPLGMSHGFFALEHDQKNSKHITKYRSFEVSDLPLERAANPFTGINVILKEVSTMNKDKRKYLVDQLGEDAVVGIEKNLKQGGNILQLLGVPSKEAAPTQPDDVETGEDATTETEVTEQPEAAVAMIAKAVAEELGMSQLSELLEKQQKQLDAQEKTIQAQTKTIEKLTKSDDQKIAEQIAPRGLFWLEKGKRPSQSDSTKIKEDEIGEGEEIHAKEGEGEGEAPHWLKSAMAVRVE